MSGSSGDEFCSSQLWSLGASSSPILYLWCFTLYVPPEDAYLRKHCAFHINKHATSCCRAAWHTRNRKDSYRPKSRPLQLIVLYLLSENHIHRLSDKRYLNLVFTLDLRCNSEHEIIKYRASSAAIKTNKKSPLIRFITEPEMWTSSCFMLQIPW